MVERIAERAGDRFRPFLELVAIAGIASAVPFIDSGRAHRPPLVMIAGEPDLREIVEAVVACDLVRREMAVVVQDWHLAGVLVIEPHGGVAVEKEILGDQRDVHGLS